MNPRIMTEEEMEVSVAVSIKAMAELDEKRTTVIEAPQPSAPIAGDTDIPVDKINNLVQKETNLKRAGVTRFKYMTVIAEALEATRWVDEPDVQGNVRRVEKPDAARRQWGAEQAAKLYGDMIERKEIEHDLGDKTLDRFRALSVSELKARAAEILKGGAQSRLPAIDV